MAYRILKEWQQYSKKKRVYTKRRIIAKGLPDLAAVEAWVKENIPRAEKVSDTRYRTPGFLFPGKLYIEGKPDSLI